MREVTARGESLYRLDEAGSAELEPDLIVTQALCAVCAVSYDDVRAIAAPPAGPAGGALARPRDARTRSSATVDELAEAAGDAGARRAR